jgi:hypothetical protein
MADRGACGGDGSVRRSLTFSARHVASFSLLAGRRQFLTAAQIAPKTPLAPPSAEAKRQLACKSVELEAEEKSPRAGEKAVRECFRLDAKGKIINTEYRLVSQEERHAKRDQEERHAKRDQEDSKLRRATSAPRNTSAAAPASNAWSQPWRTQQQWGWQWGASQQRREERREWQTPQSSGWR